MALHKTPYRRVQGLGTGLALIAAGIAVCLVGPGSASAQGAIQIVSISEPEGQSGQREVWLPISLPADIHPQSQLRLSTLPGPSPMAVGGSSCTPGVDFITVVDKPFRVNPSYPFVPVTICGDTVADGNKYVRVQVAHGTRTGEGLVLIVDEDGPPRVISLSRVRVQRSAVPFIRTPATFELRLSHAAPNDAEVQIPYFTENGTAVPGACRVERRSEPLPPPLGQVGFVMVCTGDYEARRDVLRLPAGATQGSFSIPVLGSSSQQSSWFGVRLGQPVNAQLGPANAWSSIADIEPAAPLTGVTASAAPHGRSRAMVPAERLLSGRPFVLSIGWRAPDAQGWNAVEHLDLRPTESAAGDGWWRWERHSGKFSICQPSQSDGPRSRLNAQCRHAGPKEVLALGEARLHPALSRVQGQGDGLSLQLTLSFATRRPAGKAQLELAATDRFGNQGGFETVLDAALAPETPSH